MTTKRTVKTGATKVVQTARINAADASASPQTDEAQQGDQERATANITAKTRVVTQARVKKATTATTTGKPLPPLPVVISGAQERASAAGGRLEELLRRAALARGAGHALDRRGGSGLRLSDRRDTAGPGESARRDVSGVCAVGPLDRATPTATPKPKVPAPGVNPGQQAIIDKITAVFGAYAPGAINIARCESGFDPNARNVIAIGGSHASGVFQILYPSTWNTTSYKSYSPYDADANIHAAYEIFRRDGYSWREWACKP